MFWGLTWPGWTRTHLEPKTIIQWGYQLATGVKGIAKEKYAVWAPEKKNPWVHNLIFNSFCFGVFFYAILTTIK
jgi:hypothetical protein